ncbi:hypothetical protein ACFQV2_12820 [Actinokineospora soli]|uniref:Uncharacterized protein n=1 Tax=Actinokineospora soli TaxID=1048753 RepID=A0ABW2TN86_9PSEU
MRGRDEFNFSTNLPLADAPIPYIRNRLTHLTQAQHARTRPA